MTNTERPLITGMSSLAEKYKAHKKIGVQDECGNGRIDS